MGRTGINRVEVVLIVAVSVLLAGLLAGVLARQRENGLRIHCMNNLRRVGDAVQSYHTGSALKNPFLPPARIAPDYATWAALIAPHLDAQQPLHEWQIERSYFAQDPA